MHNIQFDHLLTKLQSTDKAENRFHHLAEILIFFPDAMLRNLWCRRCVRDKYCWRGQIQGYVCGVYFLGHYPEQSIRQRKENLWNVVIAGSEILADFIINAEFLDLLLLCFFTQANMSILSRITNYGLRFLLLRVFFEKNSPYLLTSDSRHFIIPLHCIAQGENNAASYGFANSEEEGDALCASKAEAASSTSS